MEHLSSSVLFALAGGVVVWRMFWKRTRSPRVAFACPLCFTHYTLPGDTLARRRTRVRCRICRGVFEVHDGDEVCPCSDAA